MGHSMSPMELLYALGQLGIETFKWVQVGNAIGSAGLAIGLVNMIILIRLYRSRVRTVRIHTPWR